MDILKKDVTFAWTERQKSAFEQLRTAFCSTNTSKPRFHSIIYSHASKTAIGGGIKPKKIHRETLANSLRLEILNKAEQNYSMIERELFDSPLH